MPFHIRLHPPPPVPNNEPVQGSVNAAQSRGNTPPLAKPESSERPRSPEEKDVTIKRAKAARKSALGRMQEAPTAFAGSSASAALQQPQPRAAESTHCYLPLIPELMKNLAQRQSDQELTLLMRTNREMHHALNPYAMERKVIYDAKVVNTLPKLRQILGEVPFRRSRNWNPKYTLTDLDASQRVRPSLVLASRLHKFRSQDRATARQLIQSQSSLVTDEQMNEALKGPCEAAILLVQQGASVPDVIDLFNIRTEAGSTEFIWTSRIQTAACNGPGKEAVKKKEPVSSVVLRLGLNEYKREELEKLAIQLFGEDELQEGNSVDKTMENLGLRCDASRQTLSQMSTGVAG